MGCAHIPETVIQEVVVPEKPQVIVAPPVVPEPEMIIAGVKLKNTHFDFPVTLNSRVAFWVDYFSHRGRGYFEKYLTRSEYFVPYIAPLLKKSGMPEDLVYLAMIESGFNNLARSHAKAVGPWQFISATGKRYGLAVNWWIDERRDIHKSTMAAVDYLRDLYRLFQNWELAAAAYNAGESKVGRAMRRYGTRDFWVLARYSFLRPETRDYVPKIIAAAIIAKNREQFGFKAAMVRPAPDEAIAGDGEIVKVVSASDVTLEELALVPVPHDEKKLLAQPVPTPHLTKSGEVGGEQLAEFEVESPADLLKISKAAGLSYATVKALNPEVLRWCTPPQAAKFRLKLPAWTKDRFLEVYNHAAFPREVEFLTYRVRRGETLQRIARKFGLKVDPVAELNQMSPLRPLAFGMTVRLPLPSDRTRNLASLDVRDPPDVRRRRYRRHARRVFRESANRVPKRLGDVS